LLVISPETTKITFMPQVGFQKNECNGWGVTDGKLRCVATGMSHMIKYNIKMVFSIDDS
jgi:hypothetical protein